MRRKWGTVRLRTGLAREVITAALRPDLQKVKLENNKVVSALDLTFFLLNSNAANTY